MKTPTEIPEEIAREVYGKPLAECDAAEREGVKIERKARKLNRSYHAKAVDIEHVALLHVGASGPVGFESVAAYCRIHVNGLFDDYEVAAALNRLMREGFVELYDDGESFNSGPNFGKAGVLKVIGDVLEYIEDFGAHNNDLRVKALHELRARLAGEE